MYTKKYDEHGKLYFRLLTTKYNDLKWQDYTSNANTWNAIKVLACSIQLKTLKDLISVVSTLAKFVAFFIKTFIAGSFMSRPVVFSATETVCMKVSATSWTFPIRDGQWKVETKSLSLKYPWLRNLSKISDSTYLFGCYDK